MSKASSRTRTTTRQMVALAVGAVLATALTTMSAAADPPGPTATEISSISVGSTENVPQTTGSNGLVYIERGEPFDVTVTFDEPLSWNKDTDLLLEVITGPEMGRTFDGLVPAESDIGTFSGVKLYVPATGVKLEVSVDERRTGVAPKATAAFDVLSFADTYGTPTALTTIGTNGSSTDGVPCEATPDEPVCADLLLPTGAATSALLVSSGVCDDECVSGYIQILVGLNVTPESPATLIMKCDKTECGGVGVPHQKLQVALAPGDTPEDAPPCEQKGVAPPATAPVPYCVDYVQSTRDNAGDTHLYLLFTVDAKVRFP